MKQRLHTLDLQAKVSLVLVAVIVPTFLIVTIAENKFNQPLLEDEMRQIGITTAKTLANEITGLRLYSLPNPGPTIERRLQELLYLQPNIARMDVILKDLNTGEVKAVASNVEEEEPVKYLGPYPLLDQSTTETTVDESG